MSSRSASVGAQTACFTPSHSVSHSPWAAACTMWVAGRAGKLTCSASQHFGPPPVDGPGRPDHQLMPPSRQAHSAHVHPTHAPPNPAPAARAQRSQPPLQTTPCIQAYRGLFSPGGAKRSKPSCSMRFCRSSSLRQQGATGCGRDPRAACCLCSACLHLPPPPAASCAAKARMVKPNMAQG